MSKINLLVMDVDGTLTDGKIYMGQEGESVKAFNIKDGAGIALLLPKYDIVPVIITARKSKILEKRCKELKVDEIHQDCFQKLSKLKEIVSRYSIGLESVAYIGDDIPDIPCMEEIKKAGGLVLCPSDAIQEIKSLADYVSACKAGEGAVRDCIHYLIQQSKSKEIQKRIDRVIEIIVAGDFEDKPQGILSDGTQYTIQEYMTKGEEKCLIETHRSHIDVQYIISGRERFKVYSGYCLSNKEMYNEEKDIELWNDGQIVSQTILVPGSIIVVMNNQPHKGAINLMYPESVRKLVCKIEI